MDYKFEPFIGAGSRFDDRITITKIGSFGVLSGFVKMRLKSQLPKYVELFYDVDNKAIGFRFTDEQKSGRTFAFVKTGGGGSVNASSFFKTYEIDPKQFNGKYSVEEISDPSVGKLFVIKIGQ